MAKATTKRINFTKDALVELIDKHNGKRVEVYDTKQPGLIAELRGGGRFVLDGQPILNRQISQRQAQVPGRGPQLRRRMGADLALGSQRCDEGDVRLASFAASVLATCGPSPQDLPDCPGGELIRPMVSDQAQVTCASLRGANQRMPARQPH